ncbi:protein containing LysM repeats (N-terminal domain) and domain related to chitinase [Halalkalibacter wakoensis JCM 9140]|uniref:Protein containing LysM repeats (N-terminal domain) and domain related to chitinase n=1 Tax=Halalkalibacter wakoensis JCM 9140 TaxID=1236970 RepID=W4Q0C5_9BACI|nr:LysM peptidoglycan-binding domain-containing protein [Halalkalibacter wakoensis]GAE25173.1 protein containing LysM repeats (N-terminal domain) and domain related to chitinase [Halalkalibacter wakoensis JCM 9140]
MSIHIVQTGDTLWRISQQYNVPIQSIMNSNGLESPILVPGLSLYIPTNTQTVRLYEIRPGDTLWSLSRRYQTSVEAIIAANPLMNVYNLPIGQRVFIPTPIKMNMNTLGFFVPYSISYFHSVIELFADQLTYLAVVSYSFTEEGWAYVDLPDEGIPNRARELNVTPLLMIRNITAGGLFSAELAGVVLESPAYRANLIRSLMNFVQQKGYGGISIDFEFIPPQRRNDFVTFLQELKRALGPLILHVNVHAKTVDIPTNRIIGGYDYRGIGNASDIVAVMTMDYGYPGGPPDPVSPIWWVEEVIRYSLTEIERSKLQVAFPMYGYDWILGTNMTRGWSLQAAQNLAISSGANVNFDNRAMSPNFLYWIGTEGHIVWFEDIRSYDAKYKLVDFYGLAGVTYWETRLPFLQNWSYMEQHINVLKT